MTSSLTRGPLPARVYWTRRVLVLAVALLLVFGIAKVLTLGSDGSSETPEATQVAADPTGTTDPSLPVASPTEKKKGKGKGKKHSQAPVLAPPDGPCADEDIAVNPEVQRPVAGPRGDIFVVLHLRTIAAEACTWQVSPDTLTLKISSGKDDIWSSRQCPRAVPTKDVVVRKDVDTTVGLTWNGKRSDADCSRLTDWALPGYYHVTAAALAGEPADEQFELLAPSPEVITVTPKPTQKPKPSGRPQAPSSSSSSKND
ncbi:hypothetical protein H5V45_08825 [Nocardioides sp. KIGAM211]|uniref:Uncharacterized protein n=1 Tax=Nocardioides luti TaxID=2761101 RepID=A0A7X0RFM2_9ACTN|nr:hypothetical protein [Nocardioides luti]MBB6627423.1 hypothetical protein [Nocardioides luti]